MNHLYFYAVAETTQKPSAQIGNATGLDDICKEHFLRIA